MVTKLQLNVGSGFGSLRQANAFGEKGSRDSMAEGMEKGEGDREPERRGW